MATERVNLTVWESTPPTVFTLQDTLSLTSNSQTNTDGNFPYNSNSYNVITRLMTDGCFSNGTRNCSTACTQPKQVFTNFSTLANCISYLNIVRSLTDPQSFLDTEKNTRLDTVAESYGIGETNPNKTNEIFNMMESCFTAFNPALRKVELSPPSGSPPLVLSPFVFSPSASSPCEFIPSSINPDIGGIGVWLVKYPFLWSAF